MAKKKTMYVVLQQQPEGGWLDIEHDVEASSGEVAIRAVAQRLARDEGVMFDRRTVVFNAVPKRSWKPTPVSAEVQTTLKIG